MIQTIHSQDKIIILIQMVNCIMTHRHPNTLQKDNMLLKIILYAHQDVVMDTIYTPKDTNVVLIYVILFFLFLYLMLDTCLNSCNLI